MTGQTQCGLSQCGGHLVQCGGLGVNVVLPSYTLSGPSSVYTGHPAVFTLTLANGPVSDTISLSDGGGGGSFTPSSVIFTTSDTIKTFSYLNSSAGTYTITATSGDSYTINGSPATLVMTSPGPSSGYLFANGAPPRAGILPIGRY